MKQDIKTLKTKICFGMRISVLGTAAITMMAVSGCSKSDADQDIIRQDIQISAMNCPDDGPRLAQTGLCAGRAVNYLNIAQGIAPELPKKCQWVVNETKAAAGEYLLYLAAQCSQAGSVGKPAKLSFQAGAKFAQVDLVWSGLSNEAQESRLAIIGSASKDPHQNIMSYVMSDLADTGTDLGSCHVVNESDQFYANDALVVRLNDTEMAKLPKDEPHQMCGRYGLDQDNASFWRVTQGFSWFITMTQDLHHDIDPRSFTMIEPDGHEGWQTVEAVFFE